MNHAAEHPVPPLHVWGRRLWRVLAATILLLVVLRIGWGMLWRHRLHAAEAQMRAAGTWVDGPRVITAQNADEHWSLLLQAAKLASTRPTSTPIGHTQGLSLNDWAELSDAAALSLARRARMVWEQTPRQPTRVALAVVDFKGYWELQDALSEGAIRKQSGGDEAEAIRRLRDVVHIAESLYGNGGVVDVAMAGYLDLALASSVQRSVAGLGGALDPVVRRELELLLADLRNETPIEHAVDSVPCWRQPVFEWTDTTAASYGFGPILAPLAERTKARWAAYVARLSKAARAEDLSEAWRVMPPSTWEFDFEGWHYRWDSFPKMPHDWPTPTPWLRLDWGQDGEAVKPERLSKTITGLFESRMARRSMATAIAVHLFRADHGRWPTSLQQLVPAYLQSVPIDVCFGGGATMQYVVLPDARFPAGQRPVFYFANQTPIQMGADGLPVDIHQSRASEPDEPIYGHTQSLRQYRDLARLSSP